MNGTDCGSSLKDISRQVWASLYPPYETTHVSRMWARAGQLLNRAPKVSR